MELIRHDQRVQAELENRYDAMLARSRTGPKFTEAEQAEFERLRGQLVPAQPRIEQKLSGRMRKIVPQPPQALDG